MRLSQARPLFDGLTYPVATDELVDEIGDTEIDLPNGTETVADVFSRLGPETYTGSGQAYTTFLSALSDRAIGRKGYSDRDPPVHGIEGPERPSLDPLLAEDTRYDVGGPHCGICRHVKLVGDWDALPYCRLRGEIVEPVVNEVCADFATSGWSYQPGDV